MSSRKAVLVVLAFTGGIAFIGLVVPLIRVRDLRLSLEQAK